MILRSVICDAVVNYFKSDERKFLLSIVPAGSDRLKIKEGGDTGKGKS